MRAARVRVLSLLLVSSAAMSSVRAQEGGAPHAGDGATPRPEPASPDAGPPDTAVSPDPEQPQEMGYEPDQRGAIDGEPMPGPPDAYAPSADGPAVMDQAGDMEDAGWERSQEPPLFYLELLNGYGHLDPTAFSDAGPLADDQGRHGYRLGLAAGLHLSSVDAGVRFEHGFHARGVDANELALDARLGLAEGDFVPQLRLAVGLLWLSDVAARGGGTTDTLVGGSLEPGFGGRFMLGDTLSLGAALDLGFSYTKNDAVDAAGFELKLHVDLGLHL